jgi:hypothetical protein
VYEICQLQVMQATELILYVFCYQIKLLGYGSLRACSLAAAPADIASYQSNNCNCCRVQGSAPFIVAGLLHEGNIIGLGSQ